MPDRPNAKAQDVQAPKLARWPILLAGIGLAFLVCIVFFPILKFEFVDVDVPKVLLNNRDVQGLTGENLKNIFTSRSVSSYYPIRSLTYAVDYQFWGLDPRGFKLTNGLIHLANVLLIFWLVLRLYRDSVAADTAPKAWWDISVATFSAGVYAVHPVVVEPVVWVAAREELLMTLGALGCFHFHLAGRRLSETRDKTRWAVACHVCAALSCAAACLSNAVAAVIPLLITAWDLLTLARPRLRRILYATFALWVIGGATIAIKYVCDDLEAAHSAVGPSTSVIEDLGMAIDPRLEQAGVFSVERMMVVLNVYWLNLKTIVCPTDLAANYSKVPSRSFLDKEVLVGAIAIGFTCAVFWGLRRRKLMLFGLIWFGLALGPVSQIMPHHIERADRFLYLPSVGLVMAAAIGLRPLGSVLKGRVAIPAIAGAGIWSLLVIMAWGQIQTWRTTASMWQKCVDVDPNNAVAQDALASLYWDAREYGLARQHYKRAMELDFDNEEMVHRGLASLDRVFAASLADKRQFGQAIEYFNNAIREDPTYDVPLYDLALLLANCPDQTLRRPGEAVRVAERACRLTKNPSAEHLRILAEVYAAAGRLDMAVITTEKAIGLARAARQSGLAEELRENLKLYRGHSADDEGR